MSPDVLFFSLDGFEFFALNLASLLNSLRNVSVALNPSDFRHVRVPSYQCVVVFESLPLPGALDSAALVGDGAP
jgi:hypothetical protein